MAHESRGEETSRARFIAWLDHRRSEYGKRIGKGMTQKDLAKLLDLPDATEISHWKSGARTPTPEVVGKLARLFSKDEEEARQTAL